MNELGAPADVASWTRLPVFIHMATCVTVSRPLSNVIKDTVGVGVRDTVMDTVKEVLNDE